MAYLNFASLLKREMKILNILCPRVGFEPTTYRVYSRMFMALRI